MANAHAVGRYVLSEGDHVQVIRRREILGVRCQWQFTARILGSDGSVWWTDNTNEWGEKEPGCISPYIDEIWHLGRQICHGIQFEPVDEGAPRQAQRRTA